MEPRQHVPLHPLCTLEVGGAAEFFVEATTEAEILAALAWASERALPTHVLGGGSNVVIADEPLPGLVLKIASRGVVATTPSDARVEVTAAAGETWDEFVAYCVERAWAGLERLSGIPGLVGATPIQNVGAYGQQVSDTLVRLRAYDRVGGAVRTLSANDCNFAYRNSVFKRRSPGRFVVLDVTFRLGTGDAALSEIRYPELERQLTDRGGPVTCQAVRDTVIELRRSKSMVLDAHDPNRRSCGSFFLNPIVDEAEFARIAKLVPDARAVPHWPAGEGGAEGRVKLSAGWLIENAGFAKGSTSADGSVGLSSRHALAVIGRDGATGQAVVDFANAVRQAVYDRFGITLVPEPNFWGFGEGSLGGLTGVP